MPRTWGVAGCLEGERRGKVRAQCLAWAPGDGRHGHCTGRQEEELQRGKRSDMSGWVDGAWGTSEWTCSKAVIYTVLDTLVMLSRCFSSGWYCWWEEFGKELWTEDRQLNNNQKNSKSIATSPWPCARVPGESRHSCAPLPLHPHISAALPWTNKRTNGQIYLWHLTQGEWEVKAYCRLQKVTKSIY